MYEGLIKEIEIKTDNPARVVFARDTRASGARLAGALASALTATGVEFIDCEYMTTPQLHYMVRCKNTLGTPYEYGDPTEKGYYEKLSNAFKKVMKGRTTSGPLTVDCANGVGGPKLRELIKYLSPAKDGGVDINVVNDDVINPENLNSEVVLSRIQRTKERPLMNSISAEQIMSKPSNAHHLRPRLECRIGVPH